MSKIDVINQAISTLPESYDDKYIVTKDEIMPFYNFLLSEKFQRCLTETATANDVINCIHQILDSKLKTLDDIKQDKVDKFITENNITGKMTEWFRNYCSKHMNGSYLIEYGTGNMTLSDFYQEVIIEETKQTCEQYLLMAFGEELKDLANYMIPQVGMTAMEYVSKAVPTFMIDPYLVDINGQIVSVEDLIFDIAGQVIKDNNRTKQEDVVIESTIPVEEQIQEKNQNNNVLAVPTLEIEKKKDDTLSVTGKIPIIVTDLTEDEREMLTDNVLTEEDMIFDTLSKYKLSIYNITDEKSFTELVGKFNEFIAGLENVENNAYVNSIKEIIDLIAKSMIRIKSNREDLIDAMGSNLSLSGKDMDSSNQQEFDEMVYLINKVVIEAVKKGIYSPELNSEVNKQKRNVLKNTIKKDNIPIDMIQLMAEADIQFKIMEIKNLMNYVATSSFDNNYIAGTQVYINEKVKSLEESINSPEISEEARTRYIEQINAILNQEELRRGV